MPYLTWFCPFANGSAAYMSSIRRICNDSTTLEISCKGIFLKNPEKVSRGKGESEAGG